MFFHFFVVFAAQAIQPQDFAESGPMTNKSYQKTYGRFFSFLGFWQNRRMNVKKVQRETGLVASAGSRLYRGLSIRRRFFAPSFRRRADGQSAIQSASTLSDLAPALIRFPSDLNPTLIRPPSGLTRVNPA
jgi:hypothetical protein